MPAPLGPTPGPWHHLHSELRASYPIARTFGPGETLRISGLRFEDIAGGTVAVDISGPGPGSGSTVEIEDNLFVNCAYAIHLENIETVIVRGYRFEGIGMGTRVQNCQNSTFEYNEVEHLGLYDTLGTYESGGFWADNAVQILENGIDGVIEVNGNIVDNGSIDGSTPNHTEDFVNINHAAAGGTGHVDDNMIRGPATSGSSSGGCIVLDQASDNIVVQGNTCVDTNQYGVGAANSANVQILDNRVFLSWRHDAGGADHPHHSGGSQVVGILTSTYGTGRFVSVLLRGNWAVAQRANGDGSGHAYDFNFWNGGCDSGELTFVDNNFTETDGSGGPNPPPPGFGPGILPTDMFSDLDDRYFSGRRVSW